MQVLHCFAIRFIFIALNSLAKQLFVTLINRKPRQIFHTSNCWRSAPKQKIKAPHRSCLLIYKNQQRAIPLKPVL